MRCRGADQKTGIRQSPRRPGGQHGTRRTLHPDHNESRSGVPRNLDRACDAVFRTVGQQGDREIVAKAERRHDHLVAANLSRRLSLDIGSDNQRRQLWLESRDGGGNVIEWRGRRELRQHWRHRIGRRDPIRETQSRQHPQHRDRDQHDLEQPARVARNGGSIGFHARVCNGA